MKVKAMVCYVAKLLDYFLDCMECSMDGFIMECGYGTDITALNPYNLGSEQHGEKGHIS